LHQYEIFFSGAELIFAEVSAAVIETATELRARYNLKTPDALHYCHGDSSRCHSLSGRRSGSINMFGITRRIGLTTKSPR
jgi:hypothetical protein